MLAVNGATFDGLVRAGLTAGQVDDALARLGKRVHRTDIGWESRQVGGLVDFAIACYPGPGGVRTRWTSDLPLVEQAERLISAGCRISGRAISDRPGYPAISKREMPYRLVAFTEHEVDMAALGFEPDTIGFAGTELIRPADPTIFLTAAAAGYTDRTDDIITANTLLRADYPQRRRRGVAARSARPAAVPRRHRLRPPPQPAELTATTRSVRPSAPTCRRCFTELRQTQAASFVSPRPASTQTASRVRRYA